MWFDLETKDIKEHIRMAFDGIDFRDQKKKKEKNKYPCQLNQITDNRDLEPIFLDGIIITVRKRSCGKVMFLHLSVILFKGGVCPSACWNTHPWGRHPPVRHPRQAPPGQTPPQQAPPSPADVHCCRWYASYSP